MRKYVCQGAVSVLMSSPNLSFESWEPDRAGSIIPTPPLGVIEPLVLDVDLKQSTAYKREMTKE